jgi:hypothetical protein
MLEDVAFVESETQWIKQLGVIEGGELKDNEMERSINTMNRRTVRPTL